MFAIILGFGAALGLALTARSAPKQETYHWMEIGLWALFGTLIGARAGFVTANWDYFQYHWLEIPQVWLGGLSWPGAAAGWWVMMAVLAPIDKKPLGTLADGMLFLMFILFVATWLAAWETGVGYGARISNTWWSVPTLDEWGIWTPRWPLQPLGAVISILLFAGVNQLRNRLRQPGEIASLAFLGFSLTLFGLSFLRADPAQFLFSWRLDTWAALLFSILAVLACLVSFWPRRRRLPTEVNLQLPEVPDQPSSKE